jgi:putative transposase
MAYDPEKHHRRSIRLKGYDYAQPGAYFVTICVRERECVLGDVVDGKMALSDFGQIAHHFWTQVPDHFPNTSVDTFIVMPNHIHAVVIINDPSRRGEVTGEVISPLQHNAVTDTGAVTAPLQIDRPTLGQIVAYYKYQTTKQINQIRDNPGVPFWQRSFYDHIIRNDRELNAIRRYIADNPLKWELDRDNPKNIGASQRK